MAVKSTLGLEVEFFLIDKNGNITNNADKIIGRARKADANAAIIKEIGEDMLELGSEPSTKVSVSAASLLKNMNIAVKAASQEKTLLLPMATYPAEFVPAMRDTGLYSVKKKIFADKFEIAGRCVGFHLHHALPEGSFDATSKNLKAKLSEKAKRSLVQAYNFSIALDPVLTTFMQSSPFYQGKHLGKDSRMIVYRGGPALGYNEGIYSEQLQEFGELPSYHFNESDLLDTVIARYSAWKKIIRDVAPEAADATNYESLLDTTWNPVKINPHGTIELRGMDMNMPSLLFAISAAVKYIFQEIYENSLQVTPSDEGVADYFKVEKGKLFVPPDEYVRKKLQYLSAYMGMENESVRSYCHAFLGLAKNVMPQQARKLLEPFKEMVEYRHTVSDQIMHHAQKLGYAEGEEITPETARKLVLYQANNFLDDLEHADKLVGKYSNV